MHESPKKVIPTCELSAHYFWHDIFLAMRLYSLKIEKNVDNCFKRLKHMYKPSPNLQSTDLKHLIWKLVLNRSILHFRELQIILN